MMEMIPVPSRVHKSFSFWVTLGVILVNGAGVVAGVFFEQKLMSPSVFASVNSVLGFLAIVVRYIQQNIKLTEIQKDEIAVAVYDGPTKPPKEIPPLDLSADHQTHG